MSDLVFLLYREMKQASGSPLKPLMFYRRGLK